MNPLRKEVNDILLSIIGSEEMVQRWWISDNAAFGFMPPQSVWDQGEDGEEEVAAYVSAHGYR